MCAGARLLWGCAVFRPWLDGTSIASGAPSRWQLARIFFYADMRHVVGNVCVYIYAINNQ